MHQYEKYIASLTNVDFFAKPLLTQEARRSVSPRIKRYSPTSQYAQSKVDKERKPQPPVLSQSLGARRAQPQRLLSAEEPPLLESKSSGSPAEE